MSNIPGHPGDASRAAPMPATSALPSHLLWTIALAAGASVANSYYNQPLLGELSREFALSAGTVTWLPVLTQAGNALGVLFLAPLGDRLERKSLILRTLAALVLSLVLAAASSGFVQLALASLAVGLCATVAQQLVPLAIHLALSSRKGQVLGVVTGGILIGILLARVVSGWMTELWGWRSVFGFSAALMLVLGFRLAWTLPVVPPSSDLGYGRLLLSMWHLVRKHASLRQAVAVQFLLFASMIGFWATFALWLERPPLQLGAVSAGLFALVGVCGALAAPAAGRFADRRGHGAVVRAGAVGTAMAFAVLYLGGSSISALVLGIFLLDVAVQSAQVANQTMVYALDAGARSRLNTVFMGTMLLGGAFGAAAGGWAFTAHGWAGVCAFGMLSTTIAWGLSLRLNQ
ncbi:MFS transporter [Pseudomonas aeruginosa]